MESITVFLFGLIIGSFLNAIIYRLEQGGSLVTERSRCPLCSHTLSWYELIPLVSFFIQRARCRACKGAISWQYPLVELACALLFLLVWWHLPLHWQGVETVYLWYVMASLLVLFVFDWKHYILPDRVVFPLVTITLVHALWGGGFFPGAYPVWSALSFSGFFLVLYLFSKGVWIGFGDVKLGLFIGLFLGFPLVLIGFFFSYVLGAIIGGALLLVKHLSPKSQIPFGPFLVTGTLIAYFWGQQIMQWYLEIL